MEDNEELLPQLPEDEDDLPETDEAQEVVILKDTSVFVLGERFDSYDELLKRLAYHSKQSLVHYWRRDSRTVQGAYMKTARPIEPKLVYYSVKYACVHGGQKFFPRGKGHRHSMTMRTDCPAHIMVRASKTGLQLEVISVCNAHNHPVSKELYRKLPQDRRLSPTIKNEVLDLLRLGAERKCIRDYVRAATGKILTNKDLLNLGAGDRRPRSAVKPDRALALLTAINQFQANADGQQDLVLTESTDSQESSPEMDVNPSAKKGRWARIGADLMKAGVDEDILAQDSDGIDDTLGCRHDSMNDPVGGEVEIFYEEENTDAKNMIEYLYPNIGNFTIKDEQPNDNTVMEDIELEDSPPTARQISNALEIMQQDQSSESNQVCIDESLEVNTLSSDKVKFKFVNIETLFAKCQETGKVLIEQTPDGNENTLFQSFANQEDNCTDTEIDLGNILVLRDSMNEGEMCSVPIQMLKLGANGTVELKTSGEMDECISLQEDDQGILTFTDNEHNNIIIENDLNEEEIETIGETVSSSSPFGNFVSSKITVVCDLCSQRGKETSKYLLKLRKEKESLEREVKSLRTKRNKLKSDIKLDKDYAKRIAKATAERNAKMKKALESFGENDEIHPDRLQYFIP